MTFDFKEIRPYRTREEMEAAIARILNDPTFIMFAEQMFAGETLKKKMKEVLEVHTVKDFQTMIISPLLNKLIAQTSSGLTFAGLENIKKDKGHLFISNHRDIIMDSALLQGIFMDNNMPTSEIAIGSNLLIRPWITDLVKMNKSFVVKRGNVGVKEQLVNSKELSAYIHDTICNRNGSIWIAQREGRTKDGYDKTQLSLLKMFNLLGDKKTVKKNIQNLNIVPLSISYEYEPCDGLKTRELYMKSTPEGYKKTEQDDLKSMFIGLKQYKGRIHFDFGKPIDASVVDNMKGDDILEQIAKLIDAHIISNFHLYPYNYVALDILENDEKYTKNYTKEEKKLFLKHMREKLAEIEGDTTLHKEIFLKIYANPIINKQELKHNRTK